MSDSLVFFYHSTQETSLKEISTRKYYPGTRDSSRRKKLRNTRDEAIMKALFTAFGEMLRIPAWKTKTH